MSFNQHLEGLEGNAYYEAQWAKLRRDMNNKYSKEYQEYYVYALEQFLIRTYDYSEYDARVKVMQDYDEVKKDFEGINATTQALDHSGRGESPNSN